MWPLFGSSSHAKKSHHSRKEAADTAEGKHKKTSTSPGHKKHHSSRPESTDKTEARKGSREAHRKTHSREDARPRTGDSARKEAKPRTATGAGVKPSKSSSHAPPRTIERRGTEGTQKGTEALSQNRPKADSVKPKQAATAKTEADKKKEQEDAALRYELSRLTARRHGQPYPGSATTETPAPQASQQGKDLLRYIRGDIEKETKESFTEESRYRSLGIVNFSSAKDYEARTFAYGPNNDKFGRTDLENKKIVLFKTAPGTILALINRETDQIQPIWSKTQGWAVSVVFNKDMYKLAKLRQTNLTEIVQDLEKALQNAKFISL